MPLECLSLILELVLNIDLFSIDVLEVLDLSLECRHLILSKFVRDASVVINVDQFFSSEELLIVHFLERILCLHVLLVDCLEVLYLLIKLLQSDFDLAQLMVLLANLDVN